MKRFPLFTEPSACCCCCHPKVPLARHNAAPTDAASFPLLPFKLRHIKPNGKKTKTNLQTDAGKFITTLVMIRGEARIIIQRERRRQRCAADSEELSSVMECGKQGLHQISPREHQALVANNSSRKSCCEDEESPSESRKTHA